MAPKEPEAPKKKPKKKAPDKERGKTFIDKVLDLREKAGPDNLDDGTIYPRR